MGGSAGSGRGRGPLRFSRRSLLAGGAGAAALTAAGGSAWLASRGDAGDRPSVRPASPVATLAVDPLAPDQGRTPTAPDRPPATVREALRPAGDVFETKAFAPQAGVVDIDWSAGIFFMDTRSGIVTGWRVRRDAPGAVNAEGYEVSAGWDVSPGGEWIRVTAGEGQHPLLINRRTSAAYAYDERAFDLVSMSTAGMLFERIPNDAQAGVYPPIERTGDYRLVIGRDFAEVRAFTLPAGRFRPAILASPDGDWFAVADQELDEEPGVVRFLNTRTGVVIAAYQPPKREGFLSHIFIQTAGPRLRVTANWLPQKGAPEEVPGVIIGELEWGKPGLVSEQISQGLPGGTHLSPDGRYQVRQTYLRVGAQPGGEGGGERWPALILQREGRDIARFRSLALDYGDGLPEQRWLSDSSGFFAFASAFGYSSLDRSFGYLLVEPAPKFGTGVTRIGMPPIEDPRWFESTWRRGPIPAPGNPDLISFGRLELWDRKAQRWTRVRLAHEDGPTHIDPWATGSSDEMVFALPHGGHGGGGLPALVAPSRERPPFSDSLGLRVRTGDDCLNLREKPGLDAPVRACLANGASLTIIEGPPIAEGWPPLAFSITEHGEWVHVTTGDGQQGWAAAPYLAWLEGQAL